MSLDRLLAGLGEHPEARAWLEERSTKELLGKGANAGLVHHRFLKVWDRKNTESQGFPQQGKGREKSGEVQNFIEGFNDQAGHDRLKHKLEARHRQLENLADKVFSLEMKSPLVTGMGEDHPLENGFLFDRNLGIPYLSGSSVKGLCRAAAELFFGDQMAQINDCFGPDASSSDLAAGDLIFYGAYPKTIPKLDLEIVNCHHPEYYDDLRRWEKAVEERLKVKNPRPPMEIESPNPVTFLVVQGPEQRNNARGIAWQFYVGSRRRDSTALDFAQACLRFGFAYLGIGAKTSSGLGRMGFSGEAYPPLIQIRKEQTMEIMSVFLSHSSKDKPLARALRQELGRRGIIGWLDEVDLRVGGHRLSEQLREQIKKQTAFILLWTDASADSPWVNEEIKTAIEHGGPDNLIVIASDFEKAKAWLLEHEDLKDLFAHPDDLSRNEGPRLDRLIHECTELKTFDEKDSQARVTKAAQIITKGVFKLANTASASTVGLWIDQRGSGEKAECPRIDPDIKGPVLVFRPDSEPREEKSMVARHDWDHVKTSMHESMAEAGLVSGSGTIEIGGQGQFALYGVIGHELEYSPATVVARSSPRRTNSCSNKSWPDFELQPELFFADSLKPIEAELPDSASSLALIIANPEKKSLIESPKQDARGKYPGYVVFPHGVISDDDALRQLVAGVVQFLQQRYPKPKVYLYTTLPQEAVCLLFRYLRPAIISSLVFCEWVAGENNRYDEYPIF